MKYLKIVIFPSLASSHDEYVVNSLSQCAQYFSLITFSDHPKFLFCVEIRGLSEFSIAVECFACFNVSSVSSNFRMYYQIEVIHFPPFKMVDRETASSKEERQSFRNLRDLLLNIIRETEKGRLDSNKQCK